MGQCLQSDLKGSLCNKDGGTQEPLTSKKGLKPVNLYCAYIKMESYDLGSNTKVVQIKF